MPAGLLLRCALPMRPLLPPPRPGGGHRGATWPNRAGSGVARAAPADDGDDGSQPPVPIPPAPAELSARKPAVPEPMVRAERRGLPGSHSTLPAPSLRRGCLGDTQRLSGLKGDAPVTKHPRALVEQGRDLPSAPPGSLPSLLAGPSSKNRGYNPPLLAGFGEGDTTPSPAEVRTGLPRLEQSA